MYEIKIQRTFSAAHAIRLYDGTLEPLHGHDWQVDAVVTADGLDAMEVVMDFHVLARILDDLLATVHHRCLNEVPPFADHGGELAVSPTAERVAWWLAAAISPRLAENVRLVEVRVGEAPGCTAIYRPGSDGT